MGWIPEKTTRGVGSFAAVAAAAAEAAFRQVVLKARVRDVIGARCGEGRDGGVRP